MDDALVPCASGATPEVTIRAPALVAQGRHASRRLPFVLKYRNGQHLTLKCQPVGAPCLGCNAADDCFTAGVHGRTLHHDGAVPVILTGLRRNS